MNNAEKKIMRISVPRVNLWRIAHTFLGIGLASFSLASLGEAKTWMTKKRKWFTNDEYMQGLGLAQLLPGATTVNLISYLGFRLRGLPGALIATVFFLIPCFLLMLVLSHLYFQYGGMPLVSGLFRGLGALVVGLVLNTILNLWRSGVKTIFNCLIALSSFALVFYFKMGIINILLIAGSSSFLMVLLTFRFPALFRWTGSWNGLGMNRILSGSSIDNKTQQVMAIRKSSPIRGINKRFAEKVMSLFKTKSQQTLGAEESDYISDCSRADLPLHWRKMVLLVFWLVVILLIDLALIRLRPELMLMGSRFLQIGALTFGSGYAMLPFIQDSVVNQFAWLTNKQFAVALALSLITPGPVTIIGTFIGYKLAGVAGALAGMVNIYYPSWAITILVAAPYAKAGQMECVKQVIGGIVAAFIGTLIVVQIKLSTDTLVDVPTIAMAAGAFIAQRFVRIDTVWIVLGGSLVSLAVFH